MVAGGGVQWAVPLGEVVGEVGALDDASLAEIRAAIKHEIDAATDAAEAAPFPDPATVDRMLRLVRISEWKRHQAAPGPKVSRRAFGRERRYPITNGYSA